jgi:hypothetical protein
VSCSIVIINDSTVFAASRRLHALTIAPDSENSHSTLPLEAGMLRSVLASFDSQGYVLLIFDP